MPPVAPEALVLGKATADDSSAAVVTPKGASSAAGGASPRVNPYVPLAPAAVTPPTAKASEYAFEWSPAAEPHATRRTAMLAAYSKQIRALYGPDATVVVKVLASLVVQVAIASVAGQLPWWAFVVVAYTIGGTLNHGLTLAMHEVSHNIAFKSFSANRAFGILTNLSLGLPAFASFKRYHADHHRYQGEDGVDVDVPTPLETVLFNSRPGKLLWMVLQPGFYALRPLAVLPKQPRSLEAANWAAQLAFDAAIFWFCGWQGLVYLVASTLLGMGLHPMAGHFIAEHYTFVRGQETYSYYGALNWFSFNVGYHNEHHDFPFIPGSRLPQLRLIAPEFYEPLPYHASWTNVVLGYIASPSMGPHSRVKRDTLTPSEKAQIVGDVPYESAAAN